MSAAIGPARRLLALLEDERSLENRPLEDVLSDLEAHGADAAGPTRLAQQMAERMAGAAAGPAAVLLDAMVEDEAVEAEIAALESADIADIRSGLEPGTVAAVSAEAQRRAGMQSNVVGLRQRKRGAAWAWVGSLVGMAACALIVVIVWPPVWEQAAVSNSEEALMRGPDVASVLSESAGRAPDPARSAIERVDLGSAEDEADLAAPGPDMRSQTMADGAGMATEIAEIQSSEPAPAPRIPEAPPPQSPSVEMRDASPLQSAGVSEMDVSPRPGSDGVAGSVASEATAPPKPPVPDGRPPQFAGQMDMESANEPAPVDNATDVGPVTDITTLLPPRGISMVPRPRERREPAIVDPGSETRPSQPGVIEVLAYLAVNPAIAPTVPDLKIGDGYPGLVSVDDALSSRLPDALDAAAGRHVVALAELARAEDRFDAVIVLRDSAPEGGTPDPFLAFLFGDRAGVFELIRLPIRSSTTR